MKEWSCRRDSNVMAEEALKREGQAKDQAMKVVCAAAEHARAVCIAEIARKDAEHAEVVRALEEAHGETGRLEALLLAERDKVKHMQELLDASVS
jgi:hypothetical protein